MADPYHAASGIGGLDLNAADKALKDYYQPALREQLNNNVFLLMQMEKNTTDFTGRLARIALHTGRNHGVGARAEGEELPPAGRQQYENLLVKMRQQYGRIHLSGIVLEAMTPGMGSWTDALKSETKGLLRDLKRDLNRQCITPAKGTIATVASVASTKFKVTDEAEAMRMEPGMMVEFYQSSHTASTGLHVRRSATDKYSVIDTVDLDDLEVTLKAAGGDVEALPSGTATNDIIVRRGTLPYDRGSAEEEKLQREINGLEDIMGTGYLHGISQTENDVWKVGYSKSSVGLPTDNVFEKAMSRCYNISGEEIDLIITSDKVEQAYSDTMKTQKRYNPETQILKGGYEAVYVQAGRRRVGMFTDRDVPDETAYGVCMSKFTEFVLTDWQFMQRDGNVLKWVTDKDEYQAAMFKYHELTIDERQCHFKLSGLKGN